MLRVLSDMSSCGAVNGHTGLFTKLNEKKAELKFATQHAAECRAAFVDSEDVLSYAEQAQDVLQHAAQIVQQEAHSRISSVVTECLAAVFDDPYEFRMVFERKRGKTEAVLTLERRGVVLTDPLNEAGGGVVEVAAFALRLACLVLMRPPLRRVLVMDEPFKCIRGKVYRDRVRDMLLKLSAELGVQFILCVDHEAYPQFLLGDVVEVVL